MEFRNAQVASDVPGQWYPLQVQGPTSESSEPHTQRLTTSGDTSTAPPALPVSVLPSIGLTSVSTPMVSIRLAGSRSKLTENVLLGDRWSGSGVGKVHQASTMLADTERSTMLASSKDVVRIEMED